MKCLLNHLYDSQDHSIIGIITARVYLSSMERIKGGEEGEKSQEEELQWPLDH
jgi:hypothetical protein